jgi:RNA polymerase sigma-70 factor (ECF subfamily)
MDTKDEKTLMRDLADGDRQALRVIYERHAGFVHRVAYRFVGNEEDARDITQSVFLTVMQSAHRYRPEAKLTTWIYRIVVNRCLNHRSQAGRRLLTFLSVRDLEQTPASDENRPDRILDRAERWARLMAAMRELPERQRIALILSRFEGQSYEQIAGALGCTKSSVESLLFRARRSLTRHLSK